MGGNGRRRRWREGDRFRNFRVEIIFRFAMSQKVVEVVDRSAHFVRAYDVVLHGSTRSQPCQSVLDGLLLRCWWWRRKVFFLLFLSVILEISKRIFADCVFWWAHVFGLHVDY